MSEQLSGPSPEGVMHGPYDKTEFHPWDQSIGHSDAVDAAASKGLITAEQQSELHDNLNSVHMDANTEELATELEAEEERAAEEAAFYAAHPDDEPDAWDQYDHDEPDEDPLAGDVDPTGGYHEEVSSPTNTQHYHALKQRGLL